MIGTQFYSRAIVPDHPNHNLTTAPPPSRDKKTTPSLYYRSIFTDVPQPNPTTNYIKQIHTTLAGRYINNKPPNPLLGSKTPNIDRSEMDLTRKQRVTLAQLRINNCTLLQKYKHRIGMTQSEYCLRCGETPDGTPHTLLCCPNLTQQRTRYNIHSMSDLIDRSRRIGLIL